MTKPAETPTGAGEPLVQFTVRLPQTIVARVDAAREQLALKLGFPVSRSDMVSRILHKSTDEVDARRSR